MIVVNLDVLAKPGPTIVLRQPIPEGIGLWRMFYEQSMGHMALVVGQDYDKDHLEHWLMMNMIKANVYDFLYTDDPAEKAVKIHRLMSAAGRTDWYIDIDPATVSATLHRGIPSMLVNVPHILRPEWNDGHGPRTWDQIQAEVDRQKAIKAEREWKEE